MKYKLLLPVMLLVTAVLGQNPPEDKKLLQGTWLPTSAELAEKPFDEATLKSMKMLLEGEKYTVTVGKGVDKGKFKIDTTTKPKSMDISGEEGPNQGKTFLAIYDIKDDTVRICYDLTGKARPTEFKTTKGSLLFLATYKRAK